MDPIKVLITDDHAMIRESLSATLHTRPTIQVVGMAGNGREAIEKAKKLNPDVVLMDIKMPNMDGIKACRLLKKTLPDIHVIMLTVMDDESHVIEAINAGASGYILKSMPVNELLRAIKLTMEGKAMLHPSATKKLINEFKKLADDGSGKFKLSERELEVLQLLAYGYTNKEIANKLTISQQTVKSHVIHIFQKLGASDRTEAVAIALRKGMVE
ncbi:MAG: response regulator transcription factor [Actinobacteria bacterium]|nr:response regulator transcription factor [Actinomycetota bacterium]